MLATPIGVAMLIFRDRHLPRVMQARIPSGSSSKERPSHVG